MATPAKWSAEAEEPTMAKEDGLRLALLEVVYRQAVVGAGASFLVVGLMSVALWQASDHSRLMIWLGATAGVALLRYSMIIGFRRRRPQSSVVSWEQLFTGSLVLASLVWGLGSWWVLPLDSEFHQAVVFVFLAGMGGGTAVLYSANQLGAILALFSILTPVTVAFALRSSIEFRSMAVAGFVLSLIATRAIVGLGGFIRRSFELSHELDEARREAEVLARTDELTGILNRRAFYEVGDFLLEQAMRHDRPLALLFLDVDRLKEINDRDGHAAGDEALRSLATAAKQAARRIDVVGRLGGDEFGILLPDSNANHAVIVAERLRASLAKLPLPGSDGDHAVTCSIGVTERIDDDTIDELIRRADTTVYEAKNRGRDQVAR